MRKEEFHFLSHDNRTKIHGVKWIPENQKIQAVLQIAHGMVEYIERYEKFAEYMVQRGFLVVGHDHLGHGLSVRASSERGYFAKGWGHSSDILIQDMHQIYQIVHLEFADLPYFMLGHSMGSYILRRYVAYYPKELDGVVICGTGTEPKAVTYFGMFLCRCLGAFRGGHYRSDFVQRASFGRRFRKFDMTGRDLSKSWLSKNEDSIREYQKNPKSQFVFTVNGYYALFSTINYDSHMKNIKKIPKNLPILFISGADDPVGHMGKAVKKVYRQYAKAGIQDLSMKIYENDRHELLQETNRETVFYDVYRWCVKRICNCSVN